PPLGCGQALARHRPRRLPEHDTRNRRDAGNHSAMTHSFDKRHIRAVVIGLASVVIVVLIASVIVAGWPSLAKGLSGKTLYWFVRAQPLAILVLPLATCCGVCSLMPMHWRARVRVRDLRPVPADRGLLRRPGFR